MQLLPHPLRKPKVKAAALGKQEDFAADVCVCVCLRVFMFSTLVLECLD